MILIFIINSNMCVVLIECEMVIPDIRSAFQNMISCLLFFMGIFLFDTKTLQPCVCLPCNLLQLPNFDKIESWVMKYDAVWLICLFILKYSHFYSILVMEFNITCLKAQPHKNKLLITWNKSRWNNNFRVVFCNTNAKY